MDKDRQDFEKELAVLRSKLDTLEKMCLDIGMLRVATIDMKSMEKKIDSFCVAASLRL